MIAIGVFTHSDLPSFLPLAAAQNQAPIAGGAGVFVMPAQVSNTVWGCYLLDVDSQTLALYTYAPGARQLKLEAARTYRYDRRLENFNTAAPSPNEVRELLERDKRLQQNGADAGSSPNPSPAPDTATKK